jgi:hypothetical protein
VTQPEQQGNTGNIVATAAIGLALLAIEQQARQDVQDTIEALYKGLAATALLAASTAPGTLLTGLALISLGPFHTTSTALFNTARLKVRTTVSTGYAAASRTAFGHARDELGDDAPDSIPELGDNLDRILADVDTMVGHAQTDFQTTVSTHYDPADPAAIADTILDSDTTLKLRAQSATTAAVHAGSNDTLQAVYNDLQLNGADPGLMKRWRVTSATPCEMCAALDGTLVGINAEFDHNAGDDTRAYRRVWRNLTAPPRHPNCRCQLELVRT